MVTFHGKLLVITRLGIPGITTTRRESEVGADAAKMRTDLLVPWEKNMVPFIVF